MPVGAKDPIGPINEADTLDEMDVRLRNGALSLQTAWSRMWLAAKIRLNFIQVKFHYIFLEGPIPLESCLKFERLCLKLFVSTTVNV